MTTFLRLLHEDDKATALEKTIAGERNDLFFEVDPDQFAIVPGSTFAYWVSDRVRRLFKELPPFEGEGRTVKQGLSTADDFRFIRCWWEVENSRILDGQNGPNWQEDLKAFQCWCKERTFKDKSWVNFAKGGGFRPFYSDLHVVLNWANNGKEMKEFEGSVIRNPDYYFRPGLTWPLRGVKFSAQAVPAGCCFSVAGKLAVTDFPLELTQLTCVMNSSVFDFLISLFAGKVGGVQYEVGLISKVPFRGSAEHKELFKQAFYELRLNENSNELSHLFTGITNAFISRISIIEKFQSVQDQVNANSLLCYELNAEEIEGVRSVFIDSVETKLTQSEDEDEISEKVSFQNHNNPSYYFGLAFGRWDIRYATGEKVAPELPDPFAPLPVCPPGQLQNEEGLPAGPGDVPEGYPVPIPWDGILVDDPNHPDDIVARSRQVMELIWHEKAADIEHEAAEILGVGELRDYFRKSAAGGFWPDHIKRYSKSRRKAPIYWQLATGSGSYSVWLYYHRFTSDTFFKILNEYARPKLAHERQKLDRLRADFGAQPARSQQKELEAQEGFIAELAEFADEIQRVAPLWSPNLNDGVIINFAPLWRLVPQNKPWQKECKACWDSLVKGEYDWSHLAMHLWPERVVPKCQTDASLAIAHGLEDEFWQKDARDRYQPKPAPECGWEVVVRKLVADRQSPAVKAAVESLMEAPVSQSGGKGGRKRKGTA
jgi:hypothetical protein